MVQWFVNCQPFLLIHREAWVVVMGCGQWVVNRFVHSEAVYRSRNAGPVYRPAEGGPVYVLVLVLVR